MKTTGPTPTDKQPRRTGPDPQQRTARLIGGQAHGQTCPIPFKNQHVLVTMISGRPEVLDLNHTNQARDLLDRAHGEWHTYEQIKDLKPNAGGEHAFRYIDSLPQPIEEFLETIRDSTDTTDEMHAAYWQILEKPIVESCLGDH